MYAIGLPIPFRVASLPLLQTDDSVKNYGNLAGQRPVKIGSVL